MNIPNEIKILGITYQIVRQDHNNTGNNVMGQMNFNSSIIRVDTSLSLDQQESTFLHEIIEAINASLKLGLEEKTICQLEAGLYSTLSGNNLLK